MRARKPRILACPPFAVEGVDADDAGCVRTRAQHDHAGREEDRLRDQWVTKTTVVPCGRVGSSILDRRASSSRPKGSSIGECRLERQRTGVATRICMPPDSCRVGAEALELDVRASGRRAPSAAAPSRHLEWQGDVLGNRSPVEQDGVRKKPIVVVEPGLVRATVPRSFGRRLVADHAEERRLPHPDGPISETNCPTRSAGRFLQRGHVARRERLRQLADADDAHDVLRCAPTTIFRQHDCDEERDPSAAASGWLPTGSPDRASSTG